MRSLILATFACLAVVAAFGQDDGMGGYNAMRADYIGEVTGSIEDGSFDTMSGGVEITLMSDDPGRKPVPIRARTMTFAYGASGGRPSRIAMQGSVHVNHPVAAVNADKAEWDFERGEMVFTGNVVMNSDRMKNVQCEELVLNFNDGRYRMTKVKAELALPRESPDAAPADPALLRESHVTDWTGLVNTLKQQAAAEAASPGKHVITLLDAETRGILTSAPTETIVANREKLLKQLNKVMSNPKLYNEAAWAGVALDDEAKALLDKQDRAPEELTRLNRLLLRAAYPAYIAAP
ncbi:MAG TPA: hypothetical protein PKI11_13785 [Candidatus Hydrogenedentes bacterium]|nr:hypothetical protein [Candidatus Hydrogenedentota bacterium]